MFENIFLINVDGYKICSANLLIFTVSPDIDATNSITSDIIFVLQLFSAESTIWGFIFTEHLFF